MVVAGCAEELRDFVDRRSWDFCDPAEFKVPVPSPRTSRPPNYLRKVNRTLAAKGGNESSVPRLFPQVIPNIAVEIERLRVRQRPVWHCQWNVDIVIRILIIRAHESARIGVKVANGKVIEAEFGIAIFAGVRRRNKRCIIGMNPEASERDLLRVLAKNCVGHHLRACVVASQCNRPRLPSSYEVPQSGLRRIH